MRLITTKGDNIKYVVVEILMKEVAEVSQIWENQRDNIKYGLFKGFEKKAEVGKEEEKFIVIKSPDKVTRICNLDIYNILSFELYDGVERDITFFQADESDQEAALQMASETIEALRNAKKTLGESDLIDVDKFTDLPKDFSGESDNKDNSTTNVVGNHTSTYGTPHNPYCNHYGGGNTHNNDYVRKEKEPATFKRTSRKPTKIFLEKMKESVLAIQAGNYEPKIPIIKNDDDLEEEKTNTNISNLYDDEDYGHFCC